MIKNLIILITLLATNTLYATNYYVDATSGNDSNSGTTSATAWQTISKMTSMSVSFQPGDSILFKKGEVWNGDPIHSSNHPSGTVNNPITYGSYGTGAKPIINIHIEQSPTWTDEGSNIWSTITGAVSRFFKNNIEMLRNPLPSSISLGTQGTEYYTELTNGGNNLKLYIYSQTTPLNDTFQWTAHNICLNLFNANYIQLVGIDFRGGANACIEIKNNSHWKIENCDIGFNSGYGITIHNSSDIKISHCKFNSNFTVDQSSLQPAGTGIDYTGCSDGIFVGGASQNIEVDYCYFKNWSHASFSANTNDSSNVISNIIFHNNELTSPDILYGGRLAYSGYSEGGAYYNNYIHDISVANQLGGSNNHFHHNIIDNVLDSPLKADHVGIGIWMQNYNIQIRNNIIEHNVIANTQSKGFEIYSINWDYPKEFSGNVFRNNIIYNCGISENNIGIQFHKDQNGQKIYNNIIENNLIYNSNTTQTCLYQYNGTLSDVDTFNTQDTDIHDIIGGNPLFIDAANGDYHLMENSPAIDAGATPLSTEDYDGNLIANAADIGAYEYYESLEIADNQKDKIVIYPNPTLGKVFLPNQFNNEAYEIYTLIGSVVKSGIVKENSVDLSELKTGIYLINIIEIKTGNKKILKIVKK